MSLDLEPFDIIFPLSSVMPFQLIYTFGNIYVREPFAPYIYMSEICVIIIVVKFIAMINFK